MEDSIISFIDEIKKNQQIASLDRDAIKQTVVMRLLFLMGWDIFNPDEVMANFSVGNRYIDYRLNHNQSESVYIDIRNTGKPLQSCQQDHMILINKCKAEFSVLSNGIDWWMYASPDQKKITPDIFCALDFQNQESSEIASLLIASLSKAHVGDGSALKYATGLLADRQQEKTDAALSEAWKTITSGSHEGMVQLIIQTAEDICGYKPERSKAAAFLKHKSYRSEHRQDAAKSTTYLPLHRSFTPIHHSISSFSFMNQVYPVKSAGEMIVKLCETLMAEHQQDLDKLLWHSVDGKYLFSKNKNELKFSEKLIGTDIFVETQLTPKEAVKTAHSILAEFNLAKDGFQVEYETTQ